MNKGVYYIIFALMLAACTEASDQIENDISEDQIEIQKEETPAEEATRAKRDSIHTEAQPEAPVQMAKYSATWFQIEYPNDFTPSPTSPTQVYGDDYHFVETEEATFTSPDGTVEFFVFSPQWGGDPKDYLIEQPNEKTVSQSEDKSNDDSFPVSHHWVTYEDKEGKYTRAYHSVMT
ncbi:MAG: hypothetical protein AB8B56_21345, partial [Crocinitomicaceae bacterium]